MTRHILLTGANGFVGQALVQQLLQQDVKLTLVVRRPTPLALAGEAKIVQTLVTDSLFDKSVAWWRTQLQGIDTVLHAAWYVDPKDYLNTPANLECMQGTLNLAQACIAEGVQHFAGIGTCFEYSHDSSPLTVDSPLRANSLYGTSKAATYSLLQQLFSRSETRFAWYRLFYLFGENEKSGRLVSYLHERFARGETATIDYPDIQRDYLDVKQAAGMIVNALMQQATGAFNVCSGQPIALRDLALGVAAGYNAEHLLLLGSPDNKAALPPALYGVCNLPL
ncbi:NAD-dependent epimerase/dehydratase family protein [Candidatus Pantoea multigeneris]|uniref:NAD(P)-dependent oxidoreductase n=1 Tax=Candidatus Pantoea multigeneris TaxID=2608357 RepID=A0ABX0R4L5_9GAMM|nr:NAD(P)-dependent oxidoreductase [Pantoea multigeneris]NIF20348.1 NAD(P)-dependent oxidoreductase [Pantoea multigeneris]